MDAFKFIARLKRRGFVELGAGLYSTVLGKPGYPRVIKVGRGKPDGWVDYMLWADAAGYGGTFAPKMFSYRLHEDPRPVPRLNNDQTYYVAVIERMDCRISMAAGEHKKLWAQMSDVIRGWGNDPKGNLLPPAVRTFCLALKDSGLGAYDLHDGNFMMRGETVVCTDPVSNHMASSSTTRWRSTATAHPHLIAVNAALAEVAQRALIAA